MDPNSPKIDYSISLLSDKSLMDSHATAAVFVRDSKYMSCALDDFVAG